MFANYMRVRRSGLEKYQPVESRTSRSFGRFPMRNKFISDYIFQVTGKRRTPKQVGSRLQQLRDTTEGKRSAFPPPFLIPFPTFSSPSLLSPGMPA